MVYDMAVVATAYSVANALGASPKVMLSLFEAGIVESGFRNLNYGADDSLGYLQQRPSQGWKDPMDVATATRSYVVKAKANEDRYPTAGSLAQSVQRSAYPDKYDKVEKEARELLRRVGGGGDASPGLPSLPGLPSPVPIGDVLDGVNAIAGALKSMATGVVNVGGLAAQLTKLALPSNVVRVAAGGLGVILIFAGIIILGREVR